MRTNRDFYKAIETLLNERRSKPDISLEEYLSSLHSRARQLRHHKELPLAAVYALIADAFSPAPDCPDEAVEIEGIPEGYIGWDSIVRGQIRDLRQMRENGQLNDKLRYFGIKAPSGQQWYNFDPCAYLECAAAGSMGGWEEGDQTGRQYVPGHVAVFTESGNFASCDPRELHKPPKEIVGVSWDQFKDFLWCGQHYE